MTENTEHLCRNIGKPEFIAARKKIQTLLAAGYERKYIHTKLKKEGVITMSYSTFCAQFKKFRDSLEADSTRQTKTGKHPSKPESRSAGRPWPSKPEPFFIDRSRPAEELM